MKKIRILVAGGYGSVGTHVSSLLSKNDKFSPFMITYDLLKIPEIVRCNKIVMWSGTESLFQGLIFLLGIKMGLAKSLKKAGKFIKVLKGKDITLNDKLQEI
jgi:hypothetical protein